MKYFQSSRYLSVLSLEYFDLMIMIINTVSYSVHLNYSFLANPHLRNILDPVEPVF